MRGGGKLLGEAEGGPAALEGESGLGPAASSEGTPRRPERGGGPAADAAPGSSAGPSGGAASGASCAAGCACCGVWELLRWGGLRWGGAAKVCWRVAVVQVLP